jgi:predicted metal-dependent hydrolase
MGMSYAYGNAEERDERGSIATIRRAIDLTRQRPRFQNFVIAHELLHLRVRNHGKVFKALLSVHLPNWREQNVLRAQSATNGDRNRLKG